jgi:amino acid transporter
MSSVTRPSDGTAPDMFTRQATGLVRSARAKDALFYNVVWSAPALTIAFFFLLKPSFYQGSSFLLACAFAFILGIPGAFLYAMLTTAMPRSGGDYVFVSRVMSPIVGFMSNFSWVFWQMYIIGVFASYFAGLGVSAWMRMLAAFTGNLWFLHAANWFGTHWGVFVAGTATVLVSGLILIAGTRVFVRAQQFIFALYVVGALLLPVIVSLLTSHTGFIHQFNHYAATLEGTKDAAARVGSAAHAAGYTHAGFDFGHTILAISPAWFVFGFIFGSNYFAGEIRRGTRTHYIAIPGALVVSLLFILLLFPTFQHMAGGEFLNQLGAGDPTKFGFSGGTPAYPELAAIGSGSVVWGTIILLGFAFGLVLFITQTMLLASRCMLAWSVDGVMPTGLGAVSARTHTPVVATVIIMILGTAATAIFTFTTWLTTLSNLFANTLTLLAVALTGIVLPYTRKRMFDASPIARRWRGIPVITIVGALAFVAYLLTLAVLLTDEGSGTAIKDHVTTVAIEIGIFFVGAPLLYLVAKRVRERQGMDLSLSYTELPPE